MMRSHQFNDLQGDTDLAKLEYLQSLSVPRGGPIYTQIKYNGIHCRMEVTNNLTTFYTKPSPTWPEGKPWKLGFFEGIFDDLSTHLQSFADPTRPTNYYCELLVPKMRLQDIAGEVAVNRNELGPHARAGLYMVIYDRFDMRELIVNQPFKHRYDKLAKEVLHRPTGSRIAQTMTDASPVAAELLYHEAIASGQEGVIYRVDPCLFVEGSKSWHSIKRKRRYDMEGIVRYVFEGKGKHTEMMGSLEVELSNGKRVKVGRGTGIDDNFLIKLWRDRLGIIGKTVTFSYEELSTSGVPLRNQLIAIRDDEQ